MRLNKAPRMGRAVPLRFSVVVTVRNEERNLAALLDSLVTQEPPLEVVVVDAHSQDRTQAIAEDYAEKFETVRPPVRGGTRGAGRHYGGRKRGGGYGGFLG